jgi:hypothetical protein
LQVGVIRELLERRMWGHERRTVHGRRKLLMLWRKPKLLLLLLYVRGLPLLLGICQSRS